MKKIPIQKKVLIIHHNGAICGSGVSLFHLVESIMKLGMSCSVYCPSDNLDVFNELISRDIEVVAGPKSIPIYSHFNGSNFLILSHRFLLPYINILKVKKKFINLIKELNPDIVIFNSMTMFYLGKGLRQEKFKKIIVVRETFANGLLGIRTKFIKDSIGKYFDAAIFISKFDLRQSEDINIKKFVNYDRVDLNIIKPFISDNKDKKYILYTGGMSKLKGAHTIIESMRYLDDSYHLIFLQYHFQYTRKKFKNCSTIKCLIKLFLGLDYEAKILKLILNNNTFDRILFYKSDLNVKRFYDKADVVVFPSTKPHQSRPLYEAGAAKKPIIISKSKNIFEFVQDNHNGLLFESNNARDLASKVQEVFDNKHLYNKIVKNNYNQTLKSHNLNDEPLNLQKIIDET